MAKLNSNINLWFGGIDNIVPMAMFGGFCDSFDCCSVPSSK